MFTSLFLGTLGLSSQEKLKKFTVSDNDLEDREKICLSTGKLVLRNSRTI